MKGLGSFNIERELIALEELNEKELGNNVVVNSYTTSRLKWLLSVGDRDGALREVEMTTDISTKSFSDIYIDVERNEVVVEFIDDKGFIFFRER